MKKRFPCSFSCSIRVFFMSLDTFNLSVSIIWSDFPFRLCMTVQSTSVTSSILVVYYVSFSLVIVTEVLHLVSLALSIVANV